LLLLTIPTTVFSAERPNIVWVSCEDISEHLGCYGDDQATTPQIDQLAKEGVLYEQAFVAAGVCAPCRSTIITGMYHTSIGTHHMRCSAQLPEFIKPFTIAMREVGYYCTNSAKTDYQFKAPKNTWDESSGKAHWRKRKDKDQPFFSVFNFTECHESGINSDSKYHAVTKGIEKHDPATLKSLPPYYPDTPTAREYWGRYYDVITSMDRRVGKIIAELKEDGLYEDTIVIYWSDHGVGLPRAKRWLYDSGMKVPLIVRAPKKWESLIEGKPGSTIDRLVSLMDLGPSMLNLAGISAPEHMQGQAFLGKNQPPARDYVFGARDRMDERYDVIRAVRDKRFKYIRNYEPFKPYYQYMNTPENGPLMRELRRSQNDGTMNSGEALFMAATKPNEELYDTQTDPHEIKNLAANPQYREILERLRKVHLQWVLDTKDVGLIPEGELTVREKTLGDRYSILRQKGAETLMIRIRDAAAASLDGETALAKLVAATNDDDAAVRYWGAIGIGNLGTKAKSNEKTIRRLLDDPSAVVRGAAARALCHMEKPKDALPILTQILHEGTQWERLYAINVLDEIDEQAMPVIADIKKGLKYRNGLVARGKYVVRVANRTLNELQGTNNRVP
jgi:uncharacterized sulfatase